MPSNLGYAGPYGLGYGYGFELLAGSLSLTGPWPHFRSSATSRRTRTARCRKQSTARQVHVRPPVESMPSDHSRSGVPATRRFSERVKPRRPIVYRANVPGRDPSQQLVPAETEAGRLIVTRSRCALSELQRSGTSESGSESSSRAGSTNRRRRRPHLRGTRDRPNSARRGRTEARSGRAEARRVLEDGDQDPAAGDGRGPRRPRWRCSDQAGGFG